MQIGVRAINRCANSSAAAAAVNKRTMLARSPTARSEVKSEQKEGRKEGRKERREGKKEGKKEGRVSFILKINSIKSYLLV